MMSFDVVIEFRLDYMEIFQSLFYQYENNIIPCATFYFMEKVQLTFN